MPVRVLTLFSTLRPTPNKSAKLVRTRIFQGSLKSLFAGLHPMDTIEQREARAIMTQYNIGGTYALNLRMEAFEDVPEKDVPLVCLPFMLARVKNDENTNRMLFELQLAGKQVMLEFSNLLQALEDMGTEARFSDIEPASKNNLVNMTMQFIKLALEYPLRRNEGDYEAFKLELPYICISHQLSAWRGQPVPVKTRVLFMAYYFAIYGRVLDAAEQAYIICELGDSWIFFDEFRQGEYMACLRQRGLLRALPH